LARTSSPFARAQFVRFPVHLETPLVFASRRIRLRTIARCENTRAAPAGSGDGAAAFYKMVVDPPESAESNASVVAAQSPVPIRAPRSSQKLCIGGGNSPSTPIEAMAPSVERQYGAARCSARRQQPTTSLPCLSVRHPRLGGPPKLRQRYGPPPAGARSDEKVRSFKSACLIAHTSDLIFLLGVFASQSPGGKRDMLPKTY